MLGQLLKNADEILWGSDVRLILALKREAQDAFSRTY